MNIEDLLRETLSDMAQEERPPPPSRFLQARPASVRRGHWLALATALLVAVMVASTTWVTQVLSNRPEPADKKIVPSPAPVPSPPRPLREVWPDVVHVLPRQLPNGLKFTPEVFLDDNTLLVRTGEATKVAFWAYDIGSGKARKHLQFTAPAQTGYISGVVKAEGRLVWYTVSWGAYKGALDFFTAPVAGGAARKITRISQILDNGDIDLMTVADGKLVWSRTINGGVYETPITGGEPALIPSTQRLHLIQWPWAAQPPGDRFSSMVANTARLVNVRTGEQLIRAFDAGESPGADWQCMPVWCVQSITNLARRRDGSGEHTMPGELLVYPPALDRFVLLQRRGGAQSFYLYDLATGKTGDLGLYPPVGSMEAAKAWEDVLLTHTDTVFSYPRDGKQVVVDLTAIE